MPATSRPVVVLGSLNMDLVSRTDRIPGPGETVVGLDFQLHPGGKGANQAVAVARLGHAVWMLGMVGEDIFGARLRSELEQAGVRADYVGSVEGPSGTASIVVDRQGENTIIVTPGANQHVSIAYLEQNRRMIESAGAVLAQLEVPLETVECLAVLCRKSGVPLILDPAPAQELSALTLKQLSWFTPNQTEAAFYSCGARSDAEILAGLFARGPLGVIIKKGSAGAVLAASSDPPVSIGAMPVVAVDTTAAGDCFNGAFAVGLLRGWSPARSAEFAAVAAACSVTRHGAQPSMPTQQEVESLVGSTAPETMIPREV